MKYSIAGIYCVESICPENTSIKTYLGGDICSVSWSKNRDKPLKIKKSSFYFCILKTDKPTDLRIEGPSQFINTIQIQSI